VYKSPCIGSALPPQVALSWLDSSANRIKVDLKFASLKTLFALHLPSCTHTKQVCFLLTGKESTW
jgi:hypothetical protein